MTPRPFRLYTPVRVPHVVRDLATLAWYATIGGAVAVVAAQAIGVFL